jgi:RNA polymerase sigma-70 factor (ECF subfamily)
MTGAPPSVDDVVAAAFTEEWGRLVAALIRRTGDWTLAEECAQDAFVAATRRWPVDGVPDRPGAWLMTVARNRATDLQRRAAIEGRALREVAMDSERPGAEPEDDVPDERLRLIFTCCHPALALETRVALSLRTLCGLEVGEIARAFGVTEAATAKRLVRARQKITHAGIPYRVPPAHLLPERLAGVVAVLYLLFTEGYAATAGGLLRRDLSAEAIRLTRVLAALMPDEPEVLGLLALELCHDARRAARVDPEGRLVPLEDQDRTLWDDAPIAEAVRLIERARRRDEPGPYLTQAMIAALHATSGAPAETDWVQIAGLYARLAALSPSPYVELAHAVAIGMADGPDAGLRAVDALTDRLAHYHLLHATRADLLRRSGRREAAAQAYRDALTLVVNDAERDYLEHRLAEVTG